MEASGRSAERRATAHRDDAETEFARIVAFSDGVFAIAITLLVLALDVPPNADDLWASLRALDDDLFAYAVSFAVVGKFWLSHHRFYGSLERFDPILMGLNLFYLSWVVLVPFTSELLGRYAEEPASTVSYAAVMAAASGTFVFQIYYANRKGLVRADAQWADRRFAGPVNFLSALIFLLSIPVAFVSTFAAQGMWLAVFLVGRRAALWFASRSDPPGAQ